MCVLITELSYLRAKSGINNLVAPDRATSPHHPCQIRRDII